jgi:hypothetical protein
MTEVDIDIVPQQMYALTCNNYYDRDIDVIIKAPNKGAAWNMLLSKEGRKKLKKIVGHKTVYYLFEFDGEHSVVACDPEHIKFKLTVDSADKALKYFKQFCKNKFGKVLYKMTNEQFADNYDELVYWFVANDCTDDPFKLWNLTMIPLKHFDSADKYVVCESKTCCYTDATIFSSSTEYKQYNPDEEAVNEDEDKPKYFSHLMSSVEFL